MHHSFIYFFKYLFIWLYQVLVPAMGIFDLHCSMQGLQFWHSNSQLQHVGSSSLARNQTWAPCAGSAESQPLDHQGRPRTSFIFKVTSIISIIQRVGGDTDQLIGYRSALTYSSALNYSLSYSLDKAHSMMRQNQDLWVRNSPPRRDVCMGFNREAILPQMSF